MQVPEGEFVVLPEDEDMVCGIADPDTGEWLAKGPPVTVDGLRKVIQKTLAALHSIKDQELPSSTSAASKGSE